MQAEKRITSLLLSITKKEYLCENQSLNFLKDFIMEKEKLQVKLTGSSFLTAIQIILFLAAAVCLYMVFAEEDSIYLAVFVGLIVSAISIIPFKKIVKAAEYYIARIEKDYEIE